MNEEHSSADRKEAEKRPRREDVQYIANLTPFKSINERLKPSLL